MKAYSVNVLASLAGIAGFTLLCFLYQPPAVWMLVAGVLAVLTFWRRPRVRWILTASFLACVLLLTLRDHRQSTTYWSPYQKLDLRPEYENGRIVSYWLNTNDFWFQRILDLSPEYVQSHPDEFRAQPAEWNAYNLPYRIYPAPESVLVLGAGTGNDVAAALRNGAGHVTGVEIDPLIIKLGREFHFEHPYQSSKTQIILDDARAYVQNSHEKFDLIVYSLLDSHTTSSYFSNIRIDNFVYTQEALAKARQLLKPDGLLVVKFWVENPWIAGRLFGLMKTTFGEEPDAVSDRQRAGQLGQPILCRRLARSAWRKPWSDPATAAFVREHSSIRMEPARLTTDDWPYFYQHEPGTAD